jgi:hypothetical protein
MENQKYFRAKERVATIRNFYEKVLSSIVTIFIVGAINYYLDEWRHPWFLWVVFGLSISLILKALKIFNLNPFVSKDWEERKIQEFMKQEENQKRWN